MSARVVFITHPEVVIDPAVPVVDWPLSERGRARMTAGSAWAWAAGIGAIWASTERKATDAAAILGAARGIGFATRGDLGENDRSSTGYLARAEFEATADLFFARPDQSVRGWERAVDAQARIVAAVNAVLAAPGDVATTGDVAAPGADVAVVAHGAVGALLLCALEGAAISRAWDQPPGGGGFYFVFGRADRRVVHRWRAIDG